jgi:NTP pyrophosphatase (non-canonical NTP hydrolase)
MLLPFWLILFATSCFGNMVGLNISAGLNSVITIYILIPLILVPHLLLGGAMIKFDDLHEDLTSMKLVPFIGEIMVTRWSYEALAVEHFKANDFEKHFFDQDMKISEADYRTSFLIPELQARIKVAERNIDADTNREKTARDLRVLRSELDKLHEDADKPPFEYTSYLTLDKINEDVIEELQDYLIYLKLHFLNMGQKASEEKSRVYEKLIRENDREWIRQLKRDNHNQRLAEIVTNANEVNKMYEAEDELIQKKDPVFMEPRSDWGRAHFYAPVKIFQGYKIDTFWFNFFAIWAGIGILYYALAFNLLRKLLGGIDDFISGITSFAGHHEK